MRIDEHWMGGEDGDGNSSPASAEVSEARALLIYANHCPRRPQLKSQTTQEVV
jgi:hypothetical protein